MLRWITTSIRRKRENSSNAEDVTRMLRIIDENRARPADSPISGAILKNLEKKNKMIATIATNTQKKVVKKWFMRSLLPSKC